MRVQDVTHTAIEALDHAIGLGPVRRDQSMLDTMLATEPIDFVPTTGLSLTPQQ